MPPERRTGPSYMRGGVVACPKRQHEVLWHVRRGSMRGGVVAPLTNGAAACTRRGETDASGLHGWGLAVALARMLVQSVPMG